jgi:hypothetical protein
MWGKAPFSPFLGVNQILSCLLQSPGQVRFGVTFFCVEVTAVSLFLSASWTWAVTKYAWEPALEAAHGHLQACWQSPSEAVSRPPAPPATPPCQLLVCSLAYLCTCMFMYILMLIVFLKYYVLCYAFVILLWSFFFFSLGNGSLSVVRICLFLWMSVYFLMCVDKPWLTSRLCSLRSHC